MSFLRMQESPKYSPKKGIPAFAGMTSLTKLYFTIVNFFVKTISFELNFKK